MQHAEKTFSSLLCKISKLFITNAMKYYRNAGDAQ